MYATNNTWKLLIAQFWKEYRKSSVLLLLISYHLNMFWNVFWHSLDIFMLLLFSGNQNVLQIFNTQLLDSLETVKQILMKLITFYIRLTILCLKILQFSLLSSLECSKLFQRKEPNLLWFYELWVNRNFNLNIWTSKLTW